MLSIKIISGLVGLAISYALGLTVALGGVVNAFTETEREMISVERVNQYSPEADVSFEIEEQKCYTSIPFAWPAQGSITFNNVFFRYR